MNFVSLVNVNRILWEKTNTTLFNADIRIKCTDCGVQFAFENLPQGLNLFGPAVSVDGKEARLAVKPVIPDEDSEPKIN